MDAYPKELVDVLRSGGVAVMRTDTIYGIVGRADNQAAVERIFRIKGRAPDKSPIVLISDPSDMFDVYSPSILEMLQTYWPGPNSIILPSYQGPAWITRGNASIAYRLPANAVLQALIRDAGPLIAPSANPQGLVPASSSWQARDYFGDLVDYYHDSGTVSDQQQPSSLFRYQDSTFTRLR